MKEIIMVKYGEIALKGINKKTFEDMLQKYGDEMKKMDESESRPEDTSDDGDKKDE